MSNNCFRNESNVYSRRRERINEQELERFRDEYSYSYDYEDDYSDDYRSNYSDMYGDYEDDYNYDAYMGTYSDGMEYDERYDFSSTMSHVHEFEQSVKLAEEEEDRHNHRVAGVTGDAIPIRGGSNHVHRIRENTDSLDHFHQIIQTTGPAIRIRGTNKHVHLVSGQTTRVDGHRHDFLFTTQIQAPLV